MEAVDAVWSGSCYVLIRLVFGHVIVYLWSPIPWLHVQKKWSFERMNSIRQTNESSDSCGPCKRLVPAVVTKRHLSRNATPRSVYAWVIGWSSKPLLSAFFAWKPPGAWCLSAGSFGYFHTVSAFALQSKTNPCAITRLNRCVLLQKSNFKDTCLPSLGCVWTHWQLTRWHSDNWHDATLTPDTMTLRHLTRVGALTARQSISRHVDGMPMTYAGDRSCTDDSLGGGGEGIQM